MNTPIPPSHATRAALTARRTEARDARTHHRVQALSRLQTEPARTRRQVARRLGGHREPVGRWLAAYARGGPPQRLTMAQAPGNVPPLSPALHHALRDRLRQPHGVARDKAMGPGLRQADGGPLAYQTGHTFVRYTPRATRKGPRTSPRKTP